MKKAPEKNVSLYRAYRPSGFAEVRGQDQVVKVLEAAIKNKKTAHAYLFVGSRGTGKTSVARILARELGVTANDLYEIDAASNTGVDNIRELREAVQVMPLESPYKFYIVDEAHMLSKAAWNALLKTLEEPPAHVVFVLATTEQDKVPETIRSRCEVYTFKQPPREVLAQIVSDVAKKEGYKLERSAAELLALLADGSFRDALSILQKVLAVSKNKEIEVEEVEAVSGAPRGEIVRQILKALSERDINSALSAIGEASSGNMDARMLAKLLIHRVRVAILLRYAPTIAETFKSELSEPDFQLAQELSKAGTSALSSDTLRALLEAYSQMAYAAVPHLPLELAVMDICVEKK